MIEMRKISLFLIFTCCCVAEIKDVHEVFGKWIDAQRVYDDCFVEEIVTPSRICHWFTGFKRRYKAHELFQTEMPDEQVEVLIEDYNRVMRQELHGRTKPRSCEQMLAIANFFFTFCFCSSTHQQFYSMIYDPAQHGFVRLLYAVMWEHFVGQGWKNWHSTCLAGLKREADNGKRIVYIAGGNDMYQLLAHGIYNIDVIDPFLPSQPKYYAGGWLWMIKKNGIGDEIIIPVGDANIILRRLSYSEGQLFPASLSTGERVLLQESSTRWGVFKQYEKNKLGTVVFKRRFACDQDFVMTHDRVLLISFNELFFVNAPRCFGGWGIHLDAVSAEQPWFIKQLHTTISINDIKRMRSVDRAPFSFILLGSCAT